MPTANTGLSIINVMRVRVCGMFMVMVINAYLIDELNYCTPLSLSLSAVADSLRAAAASFAEVGLERVQLG